MTQRPYLLRWVRVLFLIRSITSTDWDDTTGRLVQPLAPPAAGDAPADRAGRRVELEAWRRRPRAALAARTPDRGYVRSMTISRLNGEPADRLESAGRS
jgi:hypothetical protein